LLSCVGLLEAALMALLADTGLRLSEALGIHLCDVDTRARLKSWAR
jgi:integrase